MADLSESLALEPLPPVDVEPVGRAPVSRRAIDRLFARLVVTYGRLWDDMWLGIEPEVLKQSWERELAPWLSSETGRDRIAWALDNLPVGGPPTAPRFRELVRQAPEPRPRHVALPPPPPPADPARARALLERARLNLSGRGSRAWTGQLAERLQAGEQLGFHQRAVLREMVAGAPPAEEAQP